MASFTDEPNGVQAIDPRKEAKASSPQARLYVFPDEQSEILHLITLGDKDSQHDDIQYCKSYVYELRNI